MRISDWSSDVCSSDLAAAGTRERGYTAQQQDNQATFHGALRTDRVEASTHTKQAGRVCRPPGSGQGQALLAHDQHRRLQRLLVVQARVDAGAVGAFEVTVAQVAGAAGALGRSEEHTSELQSLMRISYAVFCLKKKNSNTN